MSELKLEVGKRYETRDGRVAFVSFDAPAVLAKIRGDRIWGIIEGSNSTKIWTQDGCVWGGIQNHHLDLIRCLDDEPELVDLTKIDVPFGELDERTQDRLGGAWARGGELQFYSAHCGKWMMAGHGPSYSSNLKFRLKPEEPTYTMPTVDDKVWLAFPGAKSFTWDSGATNPYAHAKSNPDKVEHYGQWIDGDELPANLFGDLIQRGDCPWHMAIVLRPEGL